MEYIIYKLVDGEWYKYGTYDNPVNLANAAYTLGKDGFEIKVEII